MPTAAIVRSEHALHRRVAAVLALWVLGAQQGADLETASWLTGLAVTPKYLKPAEVSHQN